jgi:hypothetical protein
MGLWPFIAFEEVRQVMVFTVYLSQFYHCHEVLLFRPFSCLICPY